MIEQSVIEDMVDYVLRLEREMSKRGIHPHVQVNMFGLFIFHQFNGTRNDTKRAFDQIVERLVKEGEKDGNEK